MKNVSIWTQILYIVGSLTIILGLLKLMFGWDAIGKKVPVWVYRLFMRNTIHIKELNTKADIILSEVQYNGGKRKLNEALLEVENLGKLNNEMLKEILYRQDLNDIITNQMVLRLNAEGECVFANSAFLKTFGYLESDMEGHGWEIMLDYVDTKRLDDKIKRAIEQKSSFRDELKLRTSAGKEIEAKLIGHPYIVRDTFKSFSVMVYLINKT